MYERVALVLGGIVLAAVLVGGGYYLGDSRARAEVALSYEKPAKDAALAYLDAARRAAEAATERVVEQRKARQRTLSRIEGLERELANHPHDPRCDLSPDELRDLGALRAAYREGRGRIVSDTLPGRAAGEEPAAPLHSGSPALGLRLRGNAR